jgi:hypothetical protein
VIRLSHVFVVAMGTEEGLEASPRLRIFPSDTEIPRRFARAAFWVSAKSQRLRTKTSQAFGWDQAPKKLATPRRTDASRCK